MSDLTHRTWPEEVPYSQDNVANSLPPTFSAGSLPAQDITWSPDLQNLRSGSDMSVAIGKHLGMVVVG